MKLRRRMAWLPPIYGLAAIMLLTVGQPAAARAADFQVVWVVIGEAGASAGEQPLSVGRHLFMATDLADLSLKRVTVARLEAEPIVTTLAVGERFCLTSLRLIAYDAKRSIVKHAPMSVSVRQDYRDGMGLERSKDNICMTPSAAGEYPIRFSSLLPAADGTTRGAQIFIRVHEATPEPGGPPSAGDPSALRR